MIVLVDLTLSILFLFCGCAISSRSCTGISGIWYWNSQAMRKQLVVERSDSWPTTKSKVCLDLWANGNLGTVYVKTINTKRRWFHVALPQPDQCASTFHRFDNLRFSWLVVATIIDLALMVASQRDGWGASICTNSYPLADLPPPQILLQQTHTFDILLIHRVRVVVEVQPLRWKPLALFVISFWRWPTTTPFFHK